MSDKPREAVPTPPEFRILWVDDKLDAARIHEGKVREWFLKQYKGEGPQIDDAKTVAEAMKSLSANYYDLILTDYHLKDPHESGLVLIERIRRDHVTDIIFYTRLGALPKEVIEKVSKAGFTEVVPDSDVVPTTIAVIQDRLKRFGKVAFLRGAVISNFVELERHLNDFLAAYFRTSGGKRDAHLKTAVLENAYISFNAKLGALEMIIFGKRQASKKDKINPKFETLGFKSLNEGIGRLRKVEDDRNNLAHRIFLVGDKLQISSMGIISSYERADIVRTLDRIRKCSEFVNSLKGLC